MCQPAPCQKKKASHRPRHRRFDSERRDANLSPTRHQLHPVASLTTDNPTPQRTHMQRGGRGGWYAIAVLLPLLLYQISYPCLFNRRDRSNEAHIIRPVSSAPPPAFSLSFSNSLSPVCACAGLFASACVRVGLSVRTRTYIIRGASSSIASLFAEASPMMPRRLA